MQKDVCWALALFSAVSVAPSVLSAQCAGGGTDQSIIPQIVDGGGWATTVVLTNATPTQRTVDVRFSRDVGGSATEPWSLDFAEMTSSQASSLTLPPASILFLHTLGSAATATSGWVSISGIDICGTGPHSGYAIFAQRIPGLTDQEGIGEGAMPGQGFLVPFDNTTGSATAVAIANPGLALAISVAIRDSDGTVSQQQAIALPDQGHASFALPVQFPDTAGKTGVAEFHSGNGMFFASGVTLSIWRFYGGAGVCRQLRAAHFGAGPLILG